MHARQCIRIGKKSIKGLNTYGLKFAAECEEVGSEHDLGSAAFLTLSALTQYLDQGQRNGNDMSCEKAVMQRVSKIKSQKLTQAGPAVVVECCHLHL